jgi:pimeloyl-ACP methyl ester carboxylesterase
VLHQEILTGLQAIPVSSLNSRIEADIILAEFVPSVRIRQFLLKSLYRTKKGTYAWRINLEAISGHAADIGRGITDESIYDRPTLFIRGEKSTYLTDGDIPDIKKRFPNSKIEMIREGTHWVHAEKPDELIQILQSFL